MTRISKPSSFFFCSPALLLFVHALVSEPEATGPETQKAIYGDSCVKMNHVARIHAVT